MSIAKKDPLSDFNDLPVHHCRIFYENLLTGGDSADVLLTPNSYEGATGSPSAFTVDFDLSLDSAQSINYIAIGGLYVRLRGEAPFVEVSYATTIGGSRTIIDRRDYTSGSFGGLANPVHIFTFDKIDGVAEIRVSLQRTGTVGSYHMSYVSAGNYLQMYQPVYINHEPVTLNASDSYDDVMSETGQILGRTFFRRGQSTSFSFNNLNPVWYREKFQPFVNHAKNKPFWVQWRPDKYSNEVAFCHTVDDIIPKISNGATGDMSVNFAVRAL